MNEHPALSLALFALLALSAAVLCAQPPADRGPGHERGPGGIAELDTNGDGEITRDEYEAVDHFARLDRNGDGVLNRDDRPSREDMRERMRHRGPMSGGPAGGPPPGAMAAMMLALHADANEDRVTTAEEWQAHVDGLDTDFNGEIDASEWIAALSLPEGHEPNEERFAHLTRRLDANENGVIETAEVNEIFSRLDEDGDGQVELERRRHRRGGRG